MRFQIVIIEKVHTNDNGTDTLTEALPRKKLLFCRKKAGLVVPLN